MPHSSVTHVAAADADVFVGARGESRAPAIAGTVRAGALARARRVRCRARLDHDGACRWQRELAFFVRAGKGLEREGWSRWGSDSSRTASPSAYGRNAGRQHIVGARSAAPGGCVSRAFVVGGPLRSGGNSGSVALPQPSRCRRRRAKAEWPRANRSARRAAWAARGGFRTRHR